MRKLHRLALAVLAATALSVTTSKATPIAWELITGVGEDEGVGFSSELADLFAGGQFQDGTDNRGLFRAWLSSRFSSTLRGGSHRILAQNDTEADTTVNLIAPPAAVGANVQANASVSAGAGPRIAVPPGNAVPDSGATMLLLTAALAGLFMVRLPRAA